MSPNTSGSERDGPRSMCAQVNRDTIENLVSSTENKRVTILRDKRNPDKIVMALKSKGIDSIVYQGVTDLEKAENGKVLVIAVVESALEVLLEWVKTDTDSSKTTYIFCWRVLTTLLEDPHKSFHWDERAIYNHVLDGLGVVEELLPSAGSEEGMSIRTDLLRFGACIHPGEICGIGKQHTLALFLPTSEMSMENLKLLSTFEQKAIKGKDWADSILTLTWFHSRHDWKREETKRKLLEMRPAKLLESFRIRYQLNQSMTEKLEAQLSLLRAGHIVVKDYNSMNEIIIFDPSSFLSDLEVREGRRSGLYYLPVKWLINCIAQNRITSPSKVDTSQPALTPAYKSVSLFKYHIRNEVKEQVDWIKDIIDKWEMVEVTDGMELSPVDLHISPPLYNSSGTPAERLRTIYCLRDYVLGRGLHECCPYWHKPLTLQSPADGHQGLNGQVFLLLVPPGDIDCYWASIVNSLRGRVIQGAVAWECDEVINVRVIWDGACPVPPISPKLKIIEVISPEQAIARWEKGQCGLINSDQELEKNLAGWQDKNATFYTIGELLGAKAHPMIVRDLVATQITEDLGAYGYFVDGPSTIINAIVYGGSYAPSGSSYGLLHYNSEKYLIAGVSGRVTSSTEIIEMLLAIVNNRFSIECIWGVRADGDHHENTINAISREGFVEIAVVKNNHWFIKLELLELCIFARDEKISTAGILLKCEADENQRGGGVEENQTCTLCSQIFAIYQKSGSDKSPVLTMEDGGVYSSAFMAVCHRKGGWLEATRAGWSKTLETNGKNSTQLYNNMGQCSRESVCDALATLRKLHLSTSHRHCDPGQGLTDKGLCLSRLGSGCSSICSFCNKDIEEGEIMMHIKTQADSI